jgi:hypothetical protein
MPVTKVIHLPTLTATFLKLRIRTAGKGSLRPLQCSQKTVHYGVVVKVVQ